MLSTKYMGLSYPTYFLNSRGSVIIKYFLEYRTKQVNIFARRNVFFYTLLAKNKIKKHIL